MSPLLLMPLMLLLTLLHSVVVIVVGALRLSPYPVVERMHPNS